jgi:hypothetical protein
MEHLRPKAHGGSDAEENRWLACRRCNLHKGARLSAIDPKTGRRVRLFNPRSQKWSRHFGWIGETVFGRTAAGRATVDALRLNDPEVLIVRVNWMSVGWHPPDDE